MSGVIGPEADEQVEALIGYVRKATTAVNCLRGQDREDIAFEQFTERGSLQVGQIADTDYLDAGFAEFR